MDINLKPCPFCGGDAIVREFNAPDGSIMYSARCASGKCLIKPMTGWTYTKQRAIDAWNRRADDGTETH